MKKTTHNFKKNRAPSDSGTAALTITHKCKIISETKWGRLKDSQLILMPSKLLSRCHKSKLVKNFYVGIDRSSRTWYSPYWKVSTSLWIVGTYLRSWWGSAPKAAMLCETIARQPPSPMLRAILTLSPTSMEEAAYRTQNDNSNCRTALDQTVSLLIGIHLSRESSLRKLELKFQLQSHH